MLNTRSTEEPYLIEPNPGYFEYQLPISVKAVINWKGRLPLLRNERDEWELPGGKLESRARGTRRVPRARDSRRALLGRGGR
jgi:hypothetical protein